jgi:sulfur carrier protein ThiS
MGKVKAKIAGMIDNKMLHQTYEEEVKDSVSVADLFKSIDKKAGFFKAPFKKLLKASIKPVLLVNGEQAEIEDIATIIVKDGDEVSLLMPMAGG